MAIAEELKIVVKAEVNKAIGGLKKLQTQTDKNKKSANVLGGEIKSMALKFGSAAAAIALFRKGFTFAIEAAQIAADVTQVEMAFESMAKRVGQNGAEVLRELHKAAGGTIDALALMKQASRALVFNIAAADLKKLMQIARASATATGESVEQMFNSIVTGVARGSRMLLDNLGILVNVEDAQREYAASIGKTVESLTAMERSQATLNAVLISGSDIMERVGEAGRIVTDAEKFQRLTSAIKDMKIEMGRNLLSAVLPVVEMFTKIARAAGDAARNTRLVREAIADIAGGREIEDAVGKLGPAISELQRLTITQGIQGSKITAQQIKNTESLIAALRRQISAEQMAARWTAFATEEQKEAAKAAADRAAAEVKRANQLITWWDKVNKAFALTPEGREKAAAADIAMWESMLKEANLSAPQIEAILRDLKKQFDEAFGTVKIEGGIDGDIDENLDSINLRLFEMKANLLAVKRFWEDDAAAEFARSLVFQGKAYENLAESIGGYATRLHDVVDLQQLAGMQVDEMKERFTALENVIENDVLNAFGLLGEALVTGEEGWKNFAKGVIGSIANMLDALAEQLFIMSAIKAIGKGLTAAQGFALAAAAKVASGIIKGNVAAMAEGVIVTRPTHALIGEAGPEAVIPLSKMGSMGDTFIIMGDLTTQEEAYTRVGEFQRRRGRAW